MRRTLPLIALAAAAIPVAPAAAVPTAAPVQPPPPAAVSPREDVPLRARMVSCTRGPLPADRAVTFTASLPRRAGAARLQLRFSLLQRLGDERARTRFRRVRGVAGWDRWETSEPRRSGFVLTRRVQDLAAPASYRAVVRFRWLRADGRVLRTLSRRTRACVQPDPRPDLRLGALSAVPESPSSVRYRVAVANRGLAAAPAFGVALVVDGSLQPEVPAGPLGSGAQDVVEVVAPPCTPGSPVEVLLDTGGDVPEAREADNAVVRPCPL